MYRLGRFFILTLVLLMPLSVQVQAVEFSPSNEVQENITTLTKTKSCLNCDLSGANLNRLELSGANLAGANLSRASMALTNLSGANLQNTDLREAVFTGADLADTDMRGADLTGTLFAGAYMVGALLDGEMLNTKPYAEEKISDVEESVYVEDTVKPKTPQKTDDLTIGSRRDFEETPPVLPTENISKKIAQGPPVAVLVEDNSTDDATVAIELLPSESVTATAAKAAPAMNEVRLREDVVPSTIPDVEEIKNVQSPEVIPETTDEGEVLVKENKIDKVVPKESVVSRSTAGEPSITKSETIIESLKHPDTVENNTRTEEAHTSDMVSEETSVTSTQGITAEPEKTQPEITQNLTEESKTVELKNEVLAESNNESRGVLEKVLNIFSTAEPSTEVMKNAAILIDINRCYGCNLQGVNLSGENLGSADLEGADLRNATLKDVDFGKANLKGVNLRGADLTGADLSEADLYRADLSGADLTDADLEDALLDDAELAGVKGYNGSTLLLPDANN